jgi:hypothetical protein
MTLPEWQPALPAQPEWWDLPNMATAKTAAPQKATTRKSTATPASQQLLFVSSTEPISTQSPDLGEDWIATLLQSKVYVSQRSLAARVAPPDDQMRLLLTALAERGGKLSRAALAQRLSVPEVRLNGMLSAVRRILNVDQATVLLVDEAAGTVDLNKTLLLQQFRIALTGVSQ